MMLRLYLVRHGETAWNAEGRLQGQADVELSERGLEEARLIGARLAEVHFVAAYSSDLKRCRITAEIISGNRRLTVRETPLLREVSFGQWEGLALSEVEERFPAEYALYMQDSLKHRPPGGERLENLIQRSREFLDIVRREHADTTETSNILVVGHIGSIRGIICAALGLETEFHRVYRGIKLDNGSLSILDLGKRNVLNASNDTCHLRYFQCQDRAAEIS